jgi:hypothetical protein
MDSWSHETRFQNLFHSYKKDLNNDRRDLLEVLLSYRNDIVDIIENFLRSYTGLRYDLTVTVLLSKERLSETYKELQPSSHITKGFPEHKFKRALSLLTYILSYKLALSLNLVL